MSLYKLQNTTPAVCTGTGNNVASKNLKDKIPMMENCDKNNPPNDHPVRIPTIDYHMLDKRIYLPMVLLGNGFIRTCLYPFTNISTKQQAQRGVGDVKFTVRSTLKNEGLRGIYRGGAVHVFGQMPSSFVYIVTYEWVKHQLKSKYPEYRRLCEASAAFSAVVLSQTISNPVDIVTQSLILIKKGGKPSNKSIKLDFPEEIRSQSGFRLIGSICMSIKQQRGLRGFWKGYPASVSTFAFGSVLWWPLYSKFSDEVYKELRHYDLPLLGIKPPLLVMKPLAAVGAGCCTTLFTNPLDLFRMRLQMQNDARPYLVVWKELWREEGPLKMFTKALKPRLFRSMGFSFGAILSYESIKKFSLSDEYTIPL